MNYKNFIIGLFIGLSLIGCKNENTTYDADIQIVNKDISISLDTLKIEINTNLYPYYGITGYNESLGQFYGYNESHHSIDLFSIKNKIFLKSIQLEKEGPNHIEIINDIFLSDKEEFFIIGYFDIVNLDLSGNVISRESINSKSDNKYFTKQFFYPSQDSGFEFHKKSNSFFIKTTNMQVAEGKSHNDFYARSKLIGSYSMEKNKPNSLNIKYPEEFMETNFGFNDMLFYTLTEEDIYYLFSPLPYIYKYNLKSKKIEQTSASTNGLKFLKMDYPKLSKNSDPERSLSDYLFNSNFGPIYSNDKFVVRIYQSATPESKRSIAHTNQKEAMVQVFDRNLNLLKNISLDFNITFSGIFIDNSAVYVQVPPDNEEFISFLKITLQD